MKPVFAAIVRKMRMMPKLSQVRPLEWGCLAVAAVLVVCYRWVMDDAFVYFRYADNLLFLDRGLVYNPGEFVEGFSSPAWMILLAALRATGLPFMTILVLIGLATLVAVWCMLIALNREQAPGKDVFNFPMLYLLLNYSVLCYFTSGVDTPMSILAGVGYALFILRPRSPLLQLLVALSPLIRHEFIIPLALCLLWSWWVERRFPLRIAATAVGALGSWMLFRIYYYADLFPNTFYLKNEYNPGQGLIYVHDTMIASHAYEIFGLLAILAVVLKRRGGWLDWAPRGMMLLAAAPVVLYVIKIGGDGRHFRYLAFPFCLMVCAFGGIPERAWSRLGTRFPRPVLPAAAVLLGLLTFTFHPRQLDRHPLRAGLEHEMVDQINDAQLHRQLLSNARYADWSARVTPSILREYRATQRGEAGMVAIAQKLCVTGYIDFDRRILNSYGLTDPFLSRIDVPSERAGHKGELNMLGKWIMRTQRQAEAIGPETMIAAIRAGRAPEWLNTENNLRVVELIARKVYNDHQILENLRLAFSFPGRITFIARLGNPRPPR